MVERNKMPRQERAKQFSPFDALKGLQNALKIKEYEHDMVAKGDVSEEQTEKISKVLQGLERNDVVKIKYYEDGHYKTLQGVCKLEIENQIIKIGRISIDLNNLFDIDKIQNNLK